jgi:hypothetical protein
LTKKKNVLDEFSKKAIDNLVELWYNIKVVNDTDSWRHIEVGTLPSAAKGRKSEA